jgi:putative transposase
MKIQRTIPLVVKDTTHLVELVQEYNRFQKEITDIAYNSGKPLSALDLHKQVYYSVPSTLPSQMKCSAIRNVAGAYSSARMNRRPATKAFSFKRVAALFLFTKDFSFTRQGKLSISTSVGREKLDFIVPEYAKSDFANAISYDSITVIGSGKIHLCLTLEVPNVKGNTPVGIDLGATNALVASTEKETLFVSGRKMKVLNQRTRKTRQRLQKKLADRKAQKKDTRSVRSLLKRLGRKQRNRSKTFCRETASKLCKWVPKDAVLVFEDLRIKQVRKDRKNRSGTRRKLSQWFFNMLTQACVNKAERLGIGVDYINPAYTSQRCRKCGRLGVRRGHKFSCECGHVEHADVNASHNIRLSFTVLRSSGVVSTTPEALPIAG